jgi:hypothetical protein
MPDLLEPRIVPAGRDPVPSAERLESLLHGDERLARAELRRQIARLEAELGELFVSAFPRKGIEYTVAPGGGPRVLGVGELERVRDELAEKIAEVRGILSDRAYVETRNRELLEQMIADPAKYKWMRISNEDIGEPSCAHWHSRPRWGVLGMLMGWWRVKHSSGCPLPSGRRPAGVPDHGQVEAAQAAQASGPVPPAAVGRAVGAAASPARAGAP